MKHSEAVSYLITKLKWARIDGDIAEKNGAGGVVNYMNGQAAAFKSILWSVYGVSEAEAEAIVKAQMTQRTIFEA